MYFVGIRISKYKHNCFITTESGDVISNSFSIRNTYDGSHELLAVLNSLDHQEEIRIVLIAFHMILLYHVYITSPYPKPLALFRA